MNDFNLKNEWILWYHSINEIKWDKNSYKKLYDIKNIYDLNIIIDIFKQNHYQNGMFFIMKKGIFPNWEDPSNRLGACLSFKITSTNIINEWNNIFINCTLEKLLRENNDKVNGISISPKKEFNILKLWFLEDIDYKKEYIEIEESEVKIDNAIYRKHIIDN